MFLSSLEAATCVNQGTQDSFSMGTALNKNDTKYFQFTLDKAGTINSININSSGDSSVTISKLTCEGTDLLNHSGSNNKDTSHTYSTSINLSSGDTIYFMIDNQYNGSINVDIDIDFTPANSAPTDISIDSSSVNENMPVGTTVGTLSSDDVDAGDTHTYSLVAGSGDTDNISFNIIGDELTTNAMFDYETKSSYSVRIQSDDGDGGTFAKAFTITINDLVEGLVPSIDTPQSFSVDENVANSTPVGSVTTTNSPTSFAILSGNGDNIFSINDFGEISVSDNTNLDYDTTSSYTLEITAANDNGSDVENITINIDEGIAPTINASQTFSIDELALNTTSIGVVQAANSPTSFSIVSGNSDNIFSINDSGELTVFDNSNLDYNSTNSYTLEINASNEYGSDIKEITINIIEGSIAPADSNSYGCDMFGSVIVTYDYLDISGTANAQACGTENISYPNGQISLGSINCLSDIECGGTGAECQRSDPPANQLTYTWTHPDDGSIANESPSPTTLTNVSYGNIAYGSGSVSFEASTVNPYNGNNYMYIGDATFDQTNISFSSGDYYFESFTITKNKNDRQNFHIDATNGPVRIFVKNDLSFALNNLYLNHYGTPSDLFIYVGGNFSNPGSGGGDTRMNAYFYIEGNVILNNNSNNWIIQGGVTSEGSITIAGNNPDFIESDEASELGYGECAVCFNDLSSQGISPYSVSNSFVNLSGTTLFDLDIYKTYSGTNVRSGCNTTDGSCSQTSLSIDFDNLNNFTYSNSYDGYIFELGDYDPFQLSFIEDNNTHPFDISEYDTTPDSDGDLNISALYIADYYDQATSGKFYHIIVEECQLGAAGNNYIPGILDAVDIGCVDGQPDTLVNCSGKKISTKITGKSYDLNILDSNSSSNTLFGTAIAYLDENTTRYKYIGEINATDENGITTFTLENSDIANNWSSVSSSIATKEAWIQFYYCDSSPNWRDCYVVGGDNVYITKTYDANESSSGDKFSIRPKSFNIELNSTMLTNLKAGKSYTIDVNATFDANNSNTDGYTKTLNAQKTFNPSNPSCSMSANEALNANFTDGSYNSSTFTYSNVGDVNITFLDNSWTAIDQANGGCTADSNSSTSTPVGCNIHSIKQVVFTPSHFNVTSTLRNGANGFTYLTNKDYSTAAELNVTLTAQTENNITTTAYNDNCYAKDTQYDISYIAPIINPLGNLQKIYIKEFNTSTEANDTIGTQLSITLPSSAFSTDANGSAELNFKINFDRNASKVVNPFELNITSVDVNDSDANGSSSLNEKATFIYGRTNASRQTYEGKYGTAPIYYEAYCFGSGCDKTLLPNGMSSTRTNDIRWYINENHTSQSGTAGKVSEKGTSRVSVAGLASGDHPDDSTLMTYDESAGYPYRTTMENNASSWLVYNEDDPSATKNSFQVEFIKLGEWSGKHETDTTTKDNVNLKTNRRTMW